MNSTTRSLGAALVALLMITSVMVSGVAAEVTTTTTDSSADASTQASTSAAAPAITVNDQYHDPTTFTKLVIPYNATGEVSSPENLTIEVVNDSDDAFITWNSSLTELSGEAIVWIQNDTFSGDATIRAELVDMDNSTQLASDTGQLLADTSPPSLSDAELNDLEDGDGSVSDEDEVEIRVNATDVDSTITSVEAYPDAFGGSSPIQLSKISGTETWNATFVVNETGTTAPDGEYNVSIQAFDAAGNSQITYTDRLELNNGGGTTSPSGSLPDAPFISTADDRFEFDSSKDADVYYNATGVVGSASDIRIEFKNSSGVVIDSVTGLSSLEGKHTFSFAPGTFEKPSESVEVVLKNATSGAVLTNYSATYQHGSETVVSSTVTANQSIDTTNLSKDITFAGGLLQVQLQDGSQSGAEKYDLESLGADRTTHFWINVTVENFTPRLLLGAAQNSDWTVTQVDQNTATINISATPAETQYNESKLFTPSRPWADSNQADVKANASIGMAVADLGMLPSERQTMLNGTMLMTDAQEFGTPRYDATNDSLKLYVAAPSIAKNGGQNQGFFDALLPTALLNEWGVTSPSDLSVSAMGTQTTPASATTTSEGIRIYVPHNYSEGDIEISAATGPSLSDASLSDASGDGIVTDGEDVTVSVNASNVDTVSADASDVGGSNDLALSNTNGDTWSATFTADGSNAPDDGTYSVTVTGEDAGGNTTTAETNTLETDFHAPVEAQVLNATSEVDVWDRAFLPLRADTSGATVLVENAIWTVSLDRDGSSFGETSLNKDEIGVFNTGQTIPLSFDDGRAVAETQLAGEDVKVIAARIEPDSGTSLTNIDTLGEVQNLLTKDNVNANATFQEVDSSQLDANGDGSYSFTPSDPGQYVVFATSNASDSVSVDGNGNLSISGQTTIVGVDHVMVQRGSSTVSTDQSAYAPGDNVSVTANTGSVIQTSGNVTHTLLLYDEATFVNQSFTIAVDGSIENTSTLSDNVTLEHSVQAVNGVWTVRDTLGFGDVTVDPEYQSGQIAFGDILDFAKNNTSVSMPTTVATDTVVLNASATVSNDSADATAVVETLDSWPEGKYRLVHVATNQDGTELATSTQTVTFDQEQTPADVRYTNLSITPGDGGQVNVSGTVTGTLDVENVGGQDGTYSAKLLVNGTEVDNVSGTISGGDSISESLFATLESTGTYNVTLVAGDTQQTSNVTVVTPDTTPPSIVIVSPPPGEVPYGTDITVNVTDESGVASTHAAVPGLPAQNITTASNPRTISTSGVTEGTQTITVNATDAKGNTVTKTFTYDFVSQPRVISVTPSAGSTTGNANPWINVTYADDANPGSESGVDTSATTLTIDGQVVDLSTAATNTGTDLKVRAGRQLSTGTHTATLTITDNAGHSTTRSWTFTVDATPPSVSIGTDHTNISLKKPATRSVVANDEALDSATITVKNGSGTHYEKDITATAKATTGTITQQYAGKTTGGSTLADGTYEAVITATDTSGNSASKNVTLVVDNSKPTIVGSPEVGNANTLVSGSSSVLTNKTAQFHVDASDRTTITSATYTVVRKSSGSATSVSGTFTVNQTKAGIDLSSLNTGTYQIRVTITDDTGNVRTTTLSPTIDHDRTPPGISTVVTQKNSTALWVNVTSSETLDGTPTVELSNSSYSDTVSFTESGQQTTYNGTIEKPSNGEYTVSAEGTDIAGNTGTDDSTTDIQSVTKPAGSQVTVINERTGSFLLINLSTDVDNELVTLSGSDQTAFHLPPGMEASRFDQFEFNNSAIENVTIGIKAKPGNKPSWASNSAVKIRFWNTTSKSWEGVDTTYNQNYDIPNHGGSDDGDYWTAQRDHLSQHAPSASDTQPPSITYTSPEEKTYGADNTTISVDATLEDAETGVNETTIQLLINGSDETAGATITAIDARNYTVTYDITGLEPGDSRNVTIVAEDDAGNATSKTVNFSIADDTTDPSVTIDDPNEGERFEVGTTEVTLNASYSDDGAGIDTANVTVMRNDTDLTGAATITSSSLTVTTTGLTPGDYNFTVSVPDSAGNTATETVNVTIDADTTAPEIVIEDVNNGNALSADTTSQTITATVNDTGIGVDATSIRVLDNGLDKTGDATVTSLGDGNYSVSYTADGLTPNSQHNLTIVAADAAANSGSAEELFSVEPDTTPPTVTIVKPTDGSVAKQVSSSGATATVTLELLLGDDASGIDTTQTQLLFEGVDVTSSTIHDTNTVTFDATGLSPGTYHYTLNVKDNATNGAVVTGSFKVTVKTGPGPGPGQPSQPSQPTQPSEPGEPSEPTDPISTSPRATVSGGQGTVNVTTSGGATKIIASDVCRCATVTLELPTDQRSQQLTDTGASLNELRMTFQEDGSFDANVSFSATKPSEDVPDVAPGTEDQSFGYINVEHEASDDVLSEVTFQFSVSKDKLAERGVESGDVRLFRYNDGRWKSYKTSVVNETDDAYTFEATVPGLSVFAIGSTQQETTDFEVTDASVSATDVQIGEDVTVTATVENNGNSDGEFTAELEIDGEPVESQTVTVPAGETRDVTFTWEFGGEGDYTVSVSGTTAGTVSVSSQQTTTTTTTTTPPTTTTTTTTTSTTTTTPGPDDDGPLGAPMVVWILVLLALIAAAALFLYRQGYFE